MRRKRRRRGGGRFWIILIGASIVLALAATIWLLPAVAEKWVRKELGRLNAPPIEFEISDLSPWYTRATSVEVAFPALTVRADTISADYVPWELARGQGKTLTIDGLDVVFEPQEDNQSSEQGDWGLRFPSVPFERAFLRGGRFAVDDTFGRWEVPFEGYLFKRSDGRTEGELFVIDEGLVAGVRSEWENSEVNQGAIRLSAESMDARTWINRAGFLTEGLIPDGVELEVVQEVSIDAFAHIWEGRLEEWSALGNGGNLAINWNEMGLRFDRWAFAARHADPGLIDGYFSARGARVDYGELQLNEMYFSLEPLEDRQWVMEVPRARIAWGDRFSAYFGARLLTGFSEAGALQGLEAEGRWESATSEAFDVADGAFELSGSLSRMNVSIPLFRISSLPWMSLSDLQALIIDGGQTTQRVEVSGGALLGPEGKPIRLDFFAQIEGLDPAALRYSAGLSNRDRIIEWHADSDASADGGILAEIDGQGSSIGGRLEFALSDIDLDLSKYKVRLGGLEGEAVMPMHEVAYWQSRSAELAQLDPLTFIPNIRSIFDRLQVRGRMGRLESPQFDLDWEQMELDGVRTESGHFLGTFRLANLVWRSYSIIGLLVGIQLIDDYVDFDLAGSLTREELPISGRARWYPRGKITGEVTLGPKVLQQSSILDQFGQELRGWKLDGEIFARVRGDVESGSEPVSIVFSITEGKARNDESEISIEGISFLGDFALAVSDLRSNGLQELRIDRLAVGEHILESIIVTFDIVEPGRVDVSKIAFQWLGGEWTAAPFHFDFNNPEFKLAFAVLGANLADLAALFPDWNIDAEGLMDGVLGVAIARDRVSLIPGYLELRRSSGGRIGYSNPGWYGGQPIVEEALSDLKLEHLRMDIFDTTASRPIQIRLGGTGRSPTLNGAEVPVTIDIPVAYDPSLLEDLPIFRLGELLGRINLGIE